MQRTMLRTNSFLETTLAFALVLGVFVSVPLQRDGIGLSWDSVNHHIYLGWVADGARFDKDYFAAGSQSYQFPYLYWPIYKMASWGWTGAAAGMVWAVLHALVCFPLIHLMRSLIPERDTYSTVFRMGGVLFGVGTILVLRAPETTGNDVLAALPFLWALAIGVRAISLRDTLSVPQQARNAVCMGLLTGASIAFKLSNGFILPALLLLPMAFAARPIDRCLCAVYCFIAVVVGFWATYGWWGYQLWVHFGNPVFPFYDSAFSVLRSALDWQPPGGL